GWVVSSQPELGSVAEREYDLRKGHRKVDTRLRALVNVLIAGGGCNAFKSKSSGYIQGLEAAKDISFSQTRVKEWTRKSLGHVNASFVGPLISIQCTGIQVGDELTSCRIVVDVYKLKCVQVCELALCGE